MSDIGTYFALGNARRLTEWQEAVLRTRWRCTAFSVAFVGSFLTAGIIEEGEGPEPVATPGWMLGS